METRSYDIAAVGICATDDVSIGKSDKGIRAESAVLVRDAV